MLKAIALAAFAWMAAYMSVDWQNRFNPAPSLGRTLIATGLLLALPAMVVGLIIEGVYQIFFAPSPKKYRRDGTTE